MTKDEIYEHLAQVYLGKRGQTEEKRKTPRVKVDVGLVFNISLTVIVLASVFYGLTAFLSRPMDSQKSVIFSLNNSPLRIKYDLNFPYPQVSRFSIPIPKINAAKYSAFSFSIRGMEEGYPGVVKIILRNRKNEVSYYFVKDVNLRWQKVNIPLSHFSTITDWTNLVDVSFVLEAWNVDKKKGVVLIDEICFNSGEAKTYGM